ncbi:peptide-methionine (S)-S-oxide reductase, partial [Pseudomonas aeruginosa]|nr:peptide-methionine (S)-S-oxide reductase [Pseudomonas aeruginosa]
DDARLISTEIAHASPFYYAVDDQHLYLHNNP